MVGGLPGSHPHAKFYRFGLVSVGLRPKKTPKMVILVKICPSRKILKVDRKTTTTNFPLCNDTIIALKIILLHSVSVITNFVIPKRDKKRQTKKHHTFWSTAGDRPRIPIILGMVIEEIRPVFASPNFF